MHRPPNRAAPPLWYDTKPQKEGGEKSPLSFSGRRFTVNPAIVTLSLSFASYLHIFCCCAVSSWLELFCFVSLTLRGSYGCLAACTFTELHSFGQAFINKKKKSWRLDWGLCFCWYETSASLSLLFSSDRWCKCQTRSMPCYSASQCTLYMK